MSGCPWDVARGSPDRDLRAGRSRNATPKTTSHASDRDDSAPLDRAERPAQSGPIRESTRIPTHTTIPNPSPLEMWRACSTRYRARGRGRAGWRDGDRENVPIAKQPVPGTRSSVRSVPGASIGNQLIASLASAKTPRSTEDDRHARTAQRTAQGDRERRARCRHRDRHQSVSPTGAPRCRTGSRRCGPGRAQWVQRAGRTSAPDRCDDASERCGTGYLDECSWQCQEVKARGHPH